MPGPAHAQDGENEESHNDISFFDNKTFGKKEEQPAAQLKQIRYLLILS